MHFNDIDTLATIAFLVALNGLLWFKFCRKLNFYALEEGRNPPLSRIVSYSPMIVFPCIIGFSAFIVESFFGDNDALYFTVLAVLFFLLFGSYLVSLFWYGGIKTSEQLEKLNK